MKNTFLAKLSIAAVAALPAFAMAEDYPSVVSEVISTYSPAETKRSPEEIAKAGKSFLESLSEKRRAEAALPLDSDERAKWTNVPPRGEVGGVRLGDLGKEELQKACDLLNAVMSKNGYQMSRNIMLADDKLLPNGKPRPGFGAVNYWLAVFGEPSAESPWAIQLDGHHLAVNITLAGEKMSLSPSFIGTQPHKFPLSKKQIVPMGRETKQAHAFVEMLNDEQKKKAIISDKRGSIKTAAGKDGVVPEPEGLKCDALNAEQKKALSKLIRNWVNDLPAKQAKARMKEINSQLDQSHFSWSGPTAAGSDISYMIQGPTLIIEYGCQSLGGKPLDHLHSMYRDPTNEYGAKIVK